MLPAAETPTMASPARLRLPLHAGPGRKRAARYASASMSGTDTRGVRVAVAALMLPAATVAVHQLRYLLVFGHHAGRALHAQGDSYVG